MKYDNHWYQRLNKSALNPPAWVFGVVWPVLYVLIIASGIIYVNAKPDVGIYDRGVIAFVAQFALNLAWSPLFFSQKRICLSLAVIVLLVAAVYYTIQEFEKSSPLSAYLLVPYLLWICFATYLNFYVCYNN